MQVRKSEEFSAMPVTHILVSQQPAFSHLTGCQTKFEIRFTMLNFILFAPR